MSQISSRDTGTHAAHSLPGRAGHGTGDTGAGADRRDAIVAAMSRVPPRQSGDAERRGWSGATPPPRSAPPAPTSGRTRVAVVVFLSLMVVGYALMTYGPLDPGAAKVGLRPGLAWHFPLLVTHIFAGAVALLLGPLQLVRRIRRRPRVHRFIGRAYLFVGVFPAGLAGLGVGVLTTQGPAAAAGLLVGDLCWIATGVLGYRAARERRYRDHERWMLRNLALTFAAVTFRGWLGLLIALQLPLLGPLYQGGFGALFHTAYVTTTWLAFLPNVLVINLWLRGRDRGATRGAGRSRRSVHTAATGAHRGG